LSTIYFQKVTFPFTFAFLAVIMVLTKREVEKMELLKDRLYLAMARAGIRAADLSRKTGIGKGSISKYLSGGYEPNADRLHKLAGALDVSEAFLLGYDVAPDREAPAAAAARSETLEQEMSRRMLERICAYYKKLSFAGRVALYGDLMKKEAKDGGPEA